MSEDHDATASSTTQAHEPDSPEAPPSKRQRIDEEPAKPALSEFSLASRIAQAESGSPSSESLVGITSYVNPGLPAFEHAIIKHRFTDFLVWEIARGGQVVRLKNISRPDSSTAITSTAENAAPTNADDSQQEEPVVPDLKEFLSEEKLKELQAFVDNGKTPETESESVLSDPIESKDQRKAFHGAIRAHFEGKLASEAQDGGVIKISWNSGQGKERRSIRPSKQEQRNLPPYVQFTLHKSNRETQDCIGQLASRLGVTPKDLATAGTKDKRGVTTQLVTLRRGKRTVEEVWDTVNGLHHGRSRDAFRGRRGRGNAHRQGGGFLGRDGMTPKERGDRGIRIGDLEYVDKPLDLGMLEGNRFCIVLRDVRVPSEDIIEKAIDTLQTTGFINYYGMQRFGNSTVPTHLIGLAILQGNWEEAARLILSEKSGDSEDVLAARRAWTVDGDAGAALRALPKWAVAERSSTYACHRYRNPLMSSTVLEFYKSQGGDTNHNGALAKIPKNLRMMYVHAYQSYIWNTAVSERIRLFGCASARPGDLVFTEGETAATENADDTGTAEEANTAETAASSNGRVTQQTLMSSSKVPKVKVLTEEDASRYSIYDVVLPLPGYSVTYPTGTIGDLYRKMLEADGLDIDKMFRPKKEYSLGGQYRKILKKPNNLTWKKIRYTDPNADLVQPDEDALLGFEAPKSEEKGEKLALRLEFDLDSASYATMALREVLKSETGNVNQRALTEAMLASNEDEK